MPGHRNAYPQGGHGVLLLENHRAENQRRPGQGGQGRLTNYEGFDRAFFRGAKTPQPLKGSICPFLEPAGRGCLAGGPPLLSI